MASVTVVEPVIGMHELVVFNNGADVREDLAQGGDVTSEGVHM